VGIPAGATLRMPKHCAVRRELIFGQGDLSLLKPVHGELIRSCTGPKTRYFWSLRNVLAVGVTMLL
jgi:hypothetical protein